MPTETKQLTAEEVLERLNAIYEFSEEHDKGWANEVASDLNRLIRFVINRDDFHGNQLDVKFTSAVLRIVERVAEFEGIEAKGKPNV
jgi:hypothetical protein